MSIGVSPPSFHEGFLGQSWSHDSSLRGPGEPGQGAHLLGRESGEGEFRALSPPSYLLRALSRRAGPGLAGL